MSLGLECWVSNLRCSFAETGREIGSVKRELFWHEINLLTFVDNIVWALNRHRL